MDYERHFMAEVMAWYKLHGLVEQHSTDAALEETKRRNKKGS